jgi:CarD family transcriptional regulator
MKRMKAFGKTQDYLILKTVINEMTLSIPVDQISTVGVRPPVSSSELQDLVSVLAKADPRVPANWSRRFKNHQEKLKSGDVYQVAEVVRNLAARDRDSALSAAEKTMYDRARVNLISEIQPALRVTTEEAELYLDRALEKGVLKPAKPVTKPSTKPIVKSAAKKVAKPAVDAKPKATASAKPAAKPAAKSPVVKVTKVVKAVAKKK